MHNSSSRIYVYPPNSEDPRSITALRESQSDWSWILECSRELLWVEGWRICMSMKLHFARLDVEARVSACCRAVRCSSAHVCAREIIMTDFITVCIRNAVWERSYIAVSSINFHRHLFWRAAIVGRIAKSFSRTSKQFSRSVSGSIISH